MHTYGCISGSAIARTHRTSQILRRHRNIPLSRRVTPFSNKRIAPEVRDYRGRNFFPPVSHSRAVIVGRDAKFMENLYSVAERAAAAPSPPPPSYTASARWKNERDRYVRQSLSDLSSPSIGPRSRSFTPYLPLSLPSPPPQPFRSLRPSPSLLVLL